MCVVSGCLCVGAWRTFGCVTLCAGVELCEYAMEEEDVLRSLNAVSAAKKQVERVRLEEGGMSVSLPLQVCSYTQSSLQSLSDSGFGERRRLQRKRAAKVMA